MILAGWGESTTRTEIQAVQRHARCPAPVPVADDCDGIDAYAAENQQFNDEIVQLRAEKAANKVDCAR